MREKPFNIWFTDMLIGGPFNGEIRPLPRDLLVVDLPSPNSRDFVSIVGSGDVSVPPVFSLVTYFRTEAKVSEEAEGGPFPPGITIVFWREKSLSPYEAGWKLFSELGMRG